MEGFSDEQRGDMLKKDYEVGQKIREVRGADMDIKTWGEFDQEKFAVREWYVKGVVPVGGITIIAAPSGEKKSWVAMEMARCLASGSNFLGHKEFETRQATVLYIDRETYEGELQARGRKLGLQNLGTRLYELSRPAELSLNNNQMMSYLESIVREKKIDVVFIDTFRSIAGGLQEEKAEEIRKFFQRFSPLKKSGRSFVFLDHCRKPSQFDGYVPKKEWLFGSQDKLASVEVLMMQRSKEGSPEISVWIPKNRVAPAHPPFKIFMDEIIADTEEKIMFSFGGGIDEKKGKEEEAEEAISDYLAQGGVERTAKEIEEALSQKNIGKNAITNALKSMREKDAVACRKEGARKILYRPKPPGK